MGLENNSDKNNWVGVGTIGRKRYVGTRSSNRWGFSHHYKETEMTQTTKITKPRSVNNIAVGCSPYQINVTVL